MVAEPIRATSQERKTRGLLSIGQVLTKLSPEFPDLSPSKLRFLEGENLISPARTTSGYRKFSAQDLERLRIILTLQRDNYMPLKVIRKYFEDLENGLNPVLPTSSLKNTGSILLRNSQLTKAELVQKAAANNLLLQEAISAGLIPATDLFDEDALNILMSLVQLQRFGIEPRHLRSYRSSAERDLDLIDSALQPLTRRKDSSSKARAVELAKEMSVQLEQIRSTLLHAAISKFNS